jgi:hypothetical protein
MAIKGLKDFEGVTFFADSDEAEAFVATGPERDTSTAIMRAIVSCCGDVEEAERMWAAGPDGIRHSIIWHVKLHRHDPQELRWGTHDRWWEAA